MWPAEFAAWLDSPAGAGAALAAAWLLGSMVGSFLNVVAHRVPRGETVVHGRSHCPACGSMIRPRDNLPVLGWLLLRGRCRDCRAPIPARYPLVEAACGGLATAIAAAELASAPGGEPAALLTAWAVRTAEAMTLVAWTLLAVRGHAVSLWTVGTAVTAGILAAASLPAVAPLPIGCAAAAPATAAGPLVHAATPFVGLVAGLAAGRVPGGLAPAACGLVGAAAGWQVAILVAITAWLARPTGRRDLAAGIAATAAVVAARPLAGAWEAVCQAASGG